MSNVIYVRDAIISALRKEEKFKEFISAEMNGNYFAAADITTKKDGECDTYRLIVVKSPK